MNNKDCNQRIKLVKTCPVHGEFRNDEIVKGYEYVVGEQARAVLDGFRVKLPTVLSRHFTAFCAVVLKVTGEHPGIGNIQRSARQNIALTPMCAIATVAASLRDCHG